MAKKQVWSTVFVRPARPASRAMRPASIRVERDPLGEELLLHRAGQCVPDLIRGQRGVEQERGLRRSPVEHLGTLEQLELVAADEARLGDQISSADRFRAEAQVRDGLRAGLLRVVDEVALRVQSLLATEDLDRVLVRSHRAVGAQAEEHRAHGVGRLDVEGGVVGEARAGDVVVDPDREPSPRPFSTELREHARRPSRGELLRGQSVAAADDPRHHRALAVRVSLAQRAQHVEEQRLAEGAGLLGPVEHRDAA